MVGQDFDVFGTSTRKCSIFLSPQTVGLLYKLFQLHMDRILNCMTPNILLVFNYVHEISTSVDKKIYLLLCLNEMSTFMPKE